MVFQALNLQQTLEDLPRYFFTTNLYAPARSLFQELSRSVDIGFDPTELTGLLGGVTLQHASLVTFGYFVVFFALGYWLFHRRAVARVRRRPAVPASQAVR